MALFPPCSFLCAFWVLGCEICVCPPLCRDRLYCLLLVSGHPPIDVFRWKCLSSDRVARSGASMEVAIIFRRGPFSFLFGMFLFLCLVFCNYPFCIFRYPFSLVSFSLFIFCFLVFCFRSCPILRAIGLLDLLVFSSVDVLRDVCGFVWMGF